MFMEGERSVNALVSGDYPDFAVSAREAFAAAQAHFDLARAYHADKLLADDFYHARPFEIGLRRYGPSEIHRRSFHVNVYDEIPGSEIFHTAE